MNKRIFVLGAAITDLMGFPNGNPAPGDSVPGSITKAAGGVGRNLAENLARLGIPVELLTAFGDDDNGKKLITQCQELEIGIRHSILANGQRGAIHLAIMNAQKDLFAGIADLSVMDNVTPSYLAQQFSSLETAEALVIETNLPQDAIDWVLDQEWEIPIYLDPVSEKLSARVKGRIGKFHTIKANKRQAEVLLGRGILNAKDLDEVADQCLKEGVQRIFITMGSRGAFAADANSRIHIPAAKVKVVSTTGAGDAFHAGLIWASLRKWSLEDCCRAGLAASTIAIRSISANNSELAEGALLEHIRKFC